jgi:hypothetical protein
MEQPTKNSNPLTEAIKSISGMEKYGFKGIDVSLEISLFEYDMVWAEEEKGEWFFVYRHPQKKNEFDWGCLHEGELWSWANMNEVYSCCGTTEEGWKAMDFPLRAYHMVSFYGVQNIFGSCCGEGWEIDGGE